MADTTKEQPKSGVEKLELASVDQVLAGCACTGCLACLTCAACLACISCVACVFPPLLAPVTATAAAAAISAATAVAVSTSVGVASNLQHG
jgi:hypothetical protein